MGTVLAAYQNHLLAVAQMKEELLSAELGKGYWAGKSNKCPHISAFYNNATWSEDTRLRSLICLCLAHRPSADGGSARLAWDWLVLTLVCELSSVVHYLVLIHLEQLFLGNILFMADGRNTRWKTKASQYIYSSCLYHVWSHFMIKSRISKVEMSTLPILLGRSSKGHSKGHGYKISLQREFKGLGAIIQLTTVA